MDIGVCGGRGQPRDGKCFRAGGTNSEQKLAWQANLAHLQISGPAKESSVAVEAASLRDMVEGGLRRPESEKANI